MNDAESEPTERECPNCDMEDQWLNTEIDAKDGGAVATAAILESVAESLRHGPDEKRYDLTLEVSER